MSSSSQLNFYPYQAVNRLCTKQNPLLIVRHKTYYPLVTATIVLTMWTFYIIGIFFIIGYDKVIINAHSPLSPPIREFEFSVVNYWPHCKDLMDQYWRLTTSQFIHANPMHIASNSFIILLYGCLFENSQGHIRLFIIFQFGIITGTLGHAIFTPYRGLIGSSHGAYAICGALLVDLIFNYDVKYSVVWLCVIIGVGTQMIFDIISYFLWFDETLAYEAHLFGWIGGALMSSAILYYQSRKKWKIAISRICGLVVVCFLGYLMYHYRTNWTPESIRKKETSCCMDYFELNMEYSYVIENYYCSGYHLVERD